MKHSTYELGAWVKGIQETILGEANMMICPDCKNGMFRISAKIEGKWACLWMCNCKPTQDQLDKWEKISAEITKKASGMTARDVAHGIPAK